MLSLMTYEQPKQIRRTDAYGFKQALDDVRFGLRYARNHNVVGIDLVEVAPDYDPTGSTAILAAQILLNFLGFIFHEKS